MLADWTGYRVERLNGQRGRVVCERCGEAWSVPVCWVSKPGEQCRALLALHKRQCDARPVPNRLNNLG